MTISYVGTSGSEEADVLSYIVPMHCPTSDQGCVAHKEKVSILATSVLPTAAGREKLVEIKRAQKFKQHVGRPAESEGTCAKTGLQWINEAITERRQINIQNLSGVTDEATTHLSNLPTVRVSKGESEYTSCPPCVYNTHTSFYCNTSNCCAMLCTVT